VTSLVLIHSSSHLKIAVPIQQPDTAPKMLVTFWKDQVEAVCVPDAGQWLGQNLTVRRPGRITVNDRGEDQRANLRGLRLACIDHPLRRTRHTG
jgi:hypothetical protein